MTRRKSVCVKWTLVLLVIAFCPYVNPRPQDSTTAPVISTSTLSVEKDKPTENPIRYRYRNRSLKLNRQLDVDFSHVNINNHNNNFIDKQNSSNIIKIIDIKNVSTKSDHKTPELTTKSSNSSRKNRLVSAIYSNDPNISEYIKNDLPYNKNAPKNINIDDKKKPAIKKVITKWTDNAKDEGLDFTYETTTSDENQDSIKLNNLEIDDVTTTENSNEQSTEAAEKFFHPQDIKKLYNLFHKKHKHKPQSEHPEVIQVYSDNIYVTDRYPMTGTRPTYIFTTPTPTPIITNVGNPKPWSKPNFNVVQLKPTTRRPIIIAKPLKNQYNYHNVHNYPQYPDNDFGVTTFPPTTAYTDRIVIRPEEYAASPDECPTIFLTLNNTFQGQAKEACPDLNIAVNTNVVNKNVIVETEEEESDDAFPDGFGLPFGDDSSDEDEHSNYSDENQEHPDSGSIEEFGLTNYNAIQTQSEPATAASHPASAIHRPGHHHHRPGHHNNHDDDDDVFSFSSVLQFFKPAINAMSWLATINPLTFGLFSLLLSPLMFLFAGTSGVAALIAPWAFSGRQAPKIVHVYRPQWHWDDELKTWQLHTFENDRWAQTVARNSDEVTDNYSGRPTFFYKFKEWMKTFTSILRDREKNKKSQQNYRKNKRKKRETWTKRIK